MTALEGFRCDNCGIESRNKPGRWNEVRSMSVNRDGWHANPLRSDGLHYCSHACLRTAIDEKWEKER